MTLLPIIRHPAVYPERILVEPLSIANLSLELGEWYRKILRKITPSEIFAVCGTAVYLVQLQAFRILNFSDIPSSFGKLRSDVYSRYYFAPDFRFFMIAHDGIYFFYAVLFTMYVWSAKVMLSIRSSEY